MPCHVEVSMMSTEGEPATLWTGYCYVREYHPWHGGHNPQFGRDDGKILDFKDGKDAAIKEVADILTEKLGRIRASDRIVLAMVPGHKAKRSNTGTPLSRVIRRLATSFDRRYVAAPDLLLRYKSIPKLATGGVRSIEVHLNSIAVSDPDSVNDATIVVLDDVTTSGNSLLASRVLLEVYEPAQVGLLALGMTA
jgi:predicted amidophosphoribosyltransferase